MKRKSLFVSLMVIAALVLVGTVGAQDVVVIRQWDGMVTQTPAWEALIAEFEAANPGIDIQRDVQTNTTELLTLAFQSGAGPDLFMVPAGGATDDPFRDMVEQGWVKPLNEYPDFEDFVATFPNPENQFAEFGNVFDGNTYTMKFESDLFWLQFYVNTRLYREAGLVDDAGNPVLPENWQQVLDNSRVIKEQTGAYGYTWGGADAWSVPWVLWSCQLADPAAYGNVGFGWDHLTGRFDSANNPCVTELIDILLTMRDEQLMPPDIMSLTDEQIRVMFAQGEVAHIVGGSWIIPGIQQTNPNADEYTSTVLPVAGQESRSGSYGAGSGGRFMAIGATTQHSEEAWLWYKFIHSEAFGRIWAENQLGMSIFTPGSPEDYTTGTNVGQMETAQFFIPEPRVELRNPDVSSIERTLIGPGEGDILIGIFTNQIPDIRAALEDLDRRNQESLDLAIQDANNAGANLTVEDWIIRDWQRGVPYVNPPVYTNPDGTPIESSGS